ncbi:MAG: hypothetical protein COY42_29915 [Armatimonadetes bacterium CG_4_10_14_0_8_um_filter_66_14]|nr:MAG: hypothetical protein COY42_29915 [Armatimonadetes bacterium CG_4_10_14_0_8_um_filter_66_14]
MKITLLVLALAANALCAEQTNLGLTVKDGKLYRNGEVYRGLGVNYCDLFQELVHNGDDTRTLDGLTFLGQKKIPFVRFWSCGFWPSDWDLYFADKDEWFRRLDLVVRTAEEAGVGLIPDLFWRTETYPDLFEEFMQDWANPDSKTRAFMSTYVKEVVTRYKDSSAIWGWEFANEINRACDLPNGMEFLGKKIPARKVDLAKDARNLMTHQIAESAFVAFAEEVRKHDPFRFVTTGNSTPRWCSFHIANKLQPLWGEDNREQSLEAFKWYAPDPTDVVSVHSYGEKPEDVKYAGVTGIEATLTVLKDFARQLNKPLFVGEFAGLSPDKTELKPKFREYQTLYLDTFVKEKIDLAAHWVFDYTRDRDSMGLVRKDNECAWVIDQLAEYNERIRQQLVAERQ